jgi:cyclopropane-fatty-acyl-phospholipid synthase
MSSKSIVLKLFRAANVNFSQNNAAQNCDIVVLDDSFYTDVLHYKTLGLGEAYMAGKFTSPNLDRLLSKLQTLNTLSLWQLLRLLSIRDWLWLLKYLVFKWMLWCSWYFCNPQSILKSKQVAKEHYDLPTVLYEKMLDPTMLYSCAYWTDKATSLETAQQLKTQLIIQKLKLVDGDQVLEIGSGWGHIAATIAKQYPRCHVLGISVSQEQVQYCRKTFCDIPNVEFRLIDYRQLPAQSYDKIYSVGFFEHVGYKNYKEFFALTYSLLKENGLMLLHTITKHQHSKTNDPWFDKYIFPGGYLPSISEVVAVVESEKSPSFQLADVQEFGDYYALTLDHWWQNFQKHFCTLQQTIPSVFTNRFRRMWQFYLLMSKVGFTSKHLHLAQFVFTKNYQTVYIR